MSIHSGGSHTEPEQETQEGTRPARRFTPRIFLVLGTIGVAVIVVLAGTIVLVSKQKGITAMEAKVIGDPIARNWNQNAVAVQIRSGYLLTEGKCEWWYVVYGVPTNIGNLTTIIEYKIFSNATTIEIPRSDGYYWGSGLESNWTIDSNLLYDIALSDNEIKSWRSTYNDGNINNIGIGINLEYSQNPICVVDLSSAGIMDNPHSVRIIIDASTGEVLSVEVDN